MRAAFRLLMGLASGAVVIAVFMSVTMAQPAAPPISKGSYQALVSLEGQHSYIVYCAVCHGMDGKGGGPAVPALKVPVPDLTTMARRYGKYDQLAVQLLIKGTDRVPAAHGSTDMPIWGPIFRSEDSRQTAELRVHNLAAYIGELQVR